MLRGSGVESLQAVLMTQIVHKNALIAAVQQAHLCQPVKELDTSKLYGKHSPRFCLTLSWFCSGRPLSPIDTKSEKSSTTVMTGFSSGTGATNVASKLSPVKQQPTKAPEAFVSLQLEKVSRFVIIILCLQTSLSFIRLQAETSC
jgi:hypothetical protein